MTKKSLINFLSSEEGEKLIGGIVFRAVKEALIYEIEVINKREAAEKGEEPVQKKQTMSILELMGIYLPRIEGALRGMQEDVSRSTSKVDEQHKVSLLFMDLIQKSYQLGVLQPLLDSKKPKQIGKGDNG